MIDIKTIAKQCKHKVKEIAVQFIQISEIREYLAQEYLEGEGIEIGALQNPLKVPKASKVQYVDRLTVEDLRKQYPELRGERLVEADIIDDGEKLDKFEIETQDFVIANHFIEHCQNPIKAITNMLRVLRVNGILYLAIPDKRYTFDVDRPTTPFEHLMKDYIDGPEWSERQHCEEWARLVEKTKDEDEVQQQIEHILDIGYSIHYHVWTQPKMLELILALKNMLNFEIETFIKNSSEIIFIIKKTG